MKRFFSKPTGPTYTLANRYLKGEPIRQDYMEVALDWRCTATIKRRGQRAGTRCPKISRCSAVHATSAKAVFDDLPVGVCGIYDTLTEYSDECT